MGTDNLDNHPGLTMLNARSAVLMVLILFCTATANRCAAAGFGFSENNLDFDADSPLALPDDPAEDPNRDLDQVKSSSDQEGTDDPMAEAVPLVPLRLPRCHPDQPADDPIAEAVALAPEVVDGQFRPDDPMAEAVALVPDVVDGRFRLPPLGVKTIATEDIGNGREPENFWEGKQGNLRPLPERGDDRGSQWNWSVMNWAAANTFSYPLYFEDRMVERHGHVQFGHLQPLAAGARFLATIPMLPYLMTVNDPHDCEYKLGYYRSGSCAPVVIQRPPLERRAVIAEALTLGAIIAIFP